MALSKIADVRKLDDQALVDEILAVKRQLFELRMQKATKQEPKPHQFKHARRRLAQLITTEAERQLAAASTSNDDSN